MTTAERIAAVLYDQRVSLVGDDDHDALRQANEASRQRAVEIYFEAASNRHDEFVCAMGDHLSEPEWYPHIANAEALGRKVQRTLFEYVSRVVGFEVDEALLVTQKRDEREAIAEARATRTEAA